ncbi:MAG: hypothetical protein RR486_16380 [Clostridium sp.]|uniref:hypothetical protein n=1 Tax=Clostridium sp. TaxID=1506 RepID=UPI0030587CC6
MNYNLKRKGKKSGSTILLVLMVATVMIMLSAVVSSALVFTTKGNDLEKHKSDYVYAAEGGIEYGIEVFSKEGPFTGDIDPVKGDIGREIDFLGNPSTTNDKDIYEVRVLCRASGSSHELVSTVYNKDMKEVGKIVLPIKGKYGIAKILEYTVCPAGKIDINSTGALDFNPAKVAFNPANGSKTINANSMVGPVIEEIDTKKPEFSNYVVKSNVPRSYANFAELISEAKNPISEFRQMTLTKNDQNDGKLTNGLGYYNLNGIDVILMSSSDVYINNTGGTTALSSAVIIIDGKLIVNSAGVHLYRSTLYPTTIEMNLTGSLTMQGSPLYDVGGTGNTPGSGHNLTQLAIETFDELLQKYMTSYGASSNISGRPDIYYDDVIYDFK